MVVDSRTISSESLHPSLIKLFLESDLNIVNLECPVTTVLNNKILKTGPHIAGDAASVSSILEGLNVGLVTLANNHIMDYGHTGLQDTLSFCSDLNVDTVGAGEDIASAKLVWQKSIKGHRIAVVNFAENEWASAAADSPGANPMDLIDNKRQIEEARSSADTVLVIVHGGNEYNHFPSPRMVKQYRFFAECGADAVIGHHTHCVSGFERHNGVPIFYSLGNFLFTTKKKKLDSWYRGLVVKLSIEKGKELTFEIIPVISSNLDHSLSIMEGKDKEDVLNTIREVNQAISNEKLLQENWANFVNNVQGSVVKSVSPLAGIENVYLKAAMYRLGIHHLFLNKTYLKEHLNRIRCEAHYDVVKGSLQHYLERYKVK